VTQADERRRSLETLPSATKQALLASLRRRLQQADSAACCRCALALVDAQAPVLDLSGLPLSDACLEGLAPRVSRVRSMDFRRCTGVTTGLRSLLAHATSLELLRWGGCAQSDAAALAAWTSLLPRRLEGEEEASWEDSQGHLACSSPQLRFLVWPEAPPRVRALLKRRCPRIQLLPVLQNLCSEGGENAVACVALPRGADLALSLDESVLEALAPLLQVAAGPLGTHNTNTFFASAAEPVVHIAELFRLAYVAREERLLPKRAKNARQRQNRVSRRASASLHRAYELELRADDP